MKSLIAKLVATYGAIAVIAIILNLALLAGAVWVVVKVLQHMGVI